MILIAIFPVNKARLFVVRDRRVDGSISVWDISEETNRNTLCPRRHQYRRGGVVGILSAVNVRPECQNRMRSYRRTISIMLRSDEIGKMQKQFEPIIRLIDSTKCGVWHLSCRLSCLVDSLKRNDPNGLAAIPRGYLASAVHHRWRRYSCCRLRNLFVAGCL